MRQILSISLPDQTTQLIKKRAKKRGFDSVSGYIKYLFSLDEDLISEKELLAAAEQARKDYKEGKLKKLNSLSDLM